MNLCNIFQQEMISTCIKWKQTRHFLVCDLKWSFIGIRWNILHIYSCYVQTMTSWITSHCYDVIIDGQSSPKTGFLEVLSTRIQTESCAILTGSYQHRMKKWKLFGSWRQPAAWFQSALGDSFNDDSVMSWCHAVIHCYRSCFLRLCHHDVIRMTSLRWV